MSNYSNKFGVYTKSFGSNLPSWWGRPRSIPQMTNWQYEYFPSEFKSNYWGLRGTDHRTYYPGEEFIVWGSWALNSAYGPTAYMPFFTLSHPDANTSNKQATLQSLLIQPTDARYNNAFNYQASGQISMNMVQVGKFAEKATFDAAQTTMGLDLSKPFVLGLSGYNAAESLSAGSYSSFVQGMTSTVEIFIYGTGPTTTVDCSMQFRQITATANPDSDSTIALNNYIDLTNRRGSFARGTSPGATSGGYISLSSNTIYNCHGSVFDGCGESIFYFPEGVTTQNIEIRNGTFINFKGLASVQGGMRDTSRITFRKCTFVDGDLGVDMIGATRMRFTDTHFLDCDFVRARVGYMSEAQNCMFRNCTFFQKYKKTAAHPVYLTSGNAVSFVQCVFDSTERGVIMSAYIADAAATTGASEAEIKKWLATGAMSATAGYGSAPKFGKIRGYHTNYLFFGNHFDNIKFCPNGGENIMVEGFGSASSNYNNGGVYNSLFSGNVHTNTNGWPVSAYFAGFHNNLIYSTLSDSTGTVTFSYGAQGDSYGVEDTETVLDNQFLTTQQNNYIWRSQFRGNAARGSLEFGRAAQNNKVYQCAFVNPEICNFNDYSYTPWFYQHLPAGTNLPTGVEPPYGRLPPAVTGNFSVIKNSGTGNSMVDCSIIVESSAMNPVYLRDGISWKTFDGVQIRSPITY
jgi:hypothetical protein